MFLQPLLALLPEFPNIPSVHYGRHWPNTQFLDFTCLFGALFSYLLVS